MNDEFRGEETVIDSDEETIKHALAIIQRKQGALQRRGDGFDVGEIQGQGQSSNDDIIVRLLSNPKELAKSFGMTEKQTENVRSLIIGAGAGGGHKYLNKYFGDEVAAMIGAALSAHLVRRIIK